MCVGIHDKTRLKSQNLIWRYRIKTTYKSFSVWFRIFTRMYAITIRLQQNNTDILDVWPFGYSPLRLAPGRDLYQPNLGSHGCMEPGGRLGAGRLNGSNGPTKLVHFITKRIFLMLDPFGYSPLRLAPRRDLYQLNLSHYGCLEPGGRPGAGCLNGSNGPTNLDHFITNGYSWCWTRLDIRPYGLPQDGTYTSAI